MRIVLDTNVLVSGLLGPHGAPGEVVRMVAAGLIELCYDARIVAEYREVLLRPRFGFSVERVGALLEQIRSAGAPVSARPLRKRLPDRDDEPFLEVALAGRARCLVTGNARHFPARSREGVQVVSPSRFLEICRIEM